MHYKKVLLSSMFTNALCIFMHIVNEDKSLIEKKYVYESTYVRVPRKWDTIISVKPHDNTNSPQARKHIPIWISIFCFKNCHRSKMKNSLSQEMLWDLKFHEKDAGGHNVLGSRTSGLIRRNNNWISLQMQQLIPSKNRK